MNINFLSFKTPYEVSMELADKVRIKRKYMNLTQRQLADQSGVSLGSLKRFEQTGEIYLMSLLKIALVLNSLKEFDGLFEKPEYTSIEEILNEKRR